MMAKLEDFTEVISDYLDKGLVLIVADLLSLITVSSCLIIKVPQINTICTNKSSKGISVPGLCLELFSYTVMMSYNYSNDYTFLSYMEYPILLLQEYVLIYFVFKYQDILGRKTQIIAGLYVIICTLIYLKIFPIMILTFLVCTWRQMNVTKSMPLLLTLLQNTLFKKFQAIPCLSNVPIMPFCTPIGATSKILQLITILRTKDARSVSRTTWALSAFTNMTRIYTVYVQSHDWMLLSNFIISTFLSSSVFTAAWVFKKKPKET